MQSKDALKVAFKNTYKRWVPVVEKEKGDLKTALSRFMTDDYFPIGINPKFTFPKSSSVFTIGSCFARHVESALMQRGVNVLTGKFTFDSDHLLASVGAMGNVPNPRSLLNKYSTQAIHSELDRVLNNKSAPDNGFLQVDAENDLWVDPQLAAILKPLSFEALSGIRTSVENLVHSITMADAVFITLGLSETWYDKTSKLYLNSSPPPRLMRSMGDRFSFINSSYEEAYAAISESFEFIRKASNKSVKFIITVSPVPMSTTWTEQDVVVANSYSKSLLRVVAQNIAAKNEDVDYYPSFEIVTTSPRRLAWQSDNLHVKQEMVDFAISSFVNSYVTDSE